MTGWLIPFTMIIYQAVCHDVANDWILGSDLARVLPEFSNVPRDAKVAYAPPFGASRILSGDDLNRVGKTYGIAVNKDVRACFARGRYPLDRKAVQAAIRETLSMPQARVEVLAVSLAPVITSQLEFPLSGVTWTNGIDPTTPVVWRGRLKLGANKEFSVWAKVRVMATMTRVVALEPLASGKAIEAGQVRLETYDDFPLHNQVLRDVDQVVGRLPRHLIRANLPILVSDLIDTFQVERGEQVAVTVIAGAAQVQLEAVAQSSARQGEMVTLTNPRSGRQFRARVEGKDRALVLANLGGMAR